MPESDIRFYGVSTIGGRGQVAVPAPLRRELGLQPGDQVLFVRRWDETSGFQVCLPEYALRGILPGTPQPADAAPVPPKEEGDADDLEARLEHVRG